MGSMGRHGSLTGPLVSQTTIFPPGNLAMMSEIVCAPSSPPLIRAIADPTASYPGIEPRSTAAEQCDLPAKLHPIPLLKK
eukprot:12787051-Ditylum_brightwellii.AAC.1